MKIIKILFDKVLKDLLVKKKVKVAIISALAVVAVKCGIAEPLASELANWVGGTGIALILGIAAEDFGKAGKGVS